MQAVAQLSRTFSRLEKITLGGIAGAIFAILIYGSGLLSLLSIIPLAACVVMLLAGKWNARGFRARWIQGRKPTAIFALPIIVFITSCFALEYYRSYPNGHKIVYMNASACYMCRGSSVVIDKHIVEKSLSTNGNIVTGELGNGRTFSLNTTTGNVVYGTPGKQTR